MGYHFLLHGIFPTQELNSCLLNQQADSLPLCHLESLCKSNIPQHKNLKTSINRQTKRRCCLQGVNRAKGTSTDGETPRDKQQSHCCPGDTEHHGVRCVIPVHVGVREVWPSFKLSLLAKPTQEPPGSEAWLMQPWVLVPRAQSCNHCRQKGQDGPGEGRQPTTTHTTRTRSLLQAMMNLKEIYRLHLALQPTRFA